MENNYYQSKESVQEYIRQAEGVNGAELIERFVKVLPSKSRVLEIGSGPGSDYELLSQWYEVIGSDLSSEFLSHLAETFPEGKFIELNAVTLITNENFHGLYSNKVLHHLTTEDLEKSIVRQAELLVSDGVICHSFWKGKGSEVFKGMFVNYHTEVALTKAFSTSFEIISLTSYSEFEDGDSLLIIAKKK